MKSISAHSLLILSFLSFALIAPVSQAQTNESVLFQNWTVICGDDNYCTATTPDQSKKAGVLKVRRHNDKKAHWEISVQTNAEDQSQFRPLALRIAGQRLQSLRANRDFRSFSKPNEFFLINKPALPLLFRRMIESRRMFFTFAAGNKQRINASYSLNGLSDALLWIDEKQKRIGSRRSVEAPVERSIAKPAAPVGKPLLDAETLATNLHRKTLDPEACDLSPEKIYSIGVSVEALDEATTLVIIPCFTAAHNTLSRVFLVNEKNQKASLQLWATFSTFTGWVGSDLLSNVSFDNQTKELAMLHKGRGIGDCGISGIWRWRDDGRFEMKEFRAKDDCDGRDDGWPLIFPLSAPQNAPNSGTNP